MRGFIVLDVVATPLTWLLAAFISLLAFNIVKDERAAEARGTQLVAIAEECLDGWEKTIGDLQVCTDVCEHYAALECPCPAEAFGLTCSCWMPSPITIGRSPPRP